MTARNADRTFEEEVLERLAQIESKVTSREEICLIHKADLKAVKKELDGNGEPGLKSAVAKLRVDFKIFEAKVLTYATIGAAVGGWVLQKAANKMGW